MTSPPQQMGLFEKKVSRGTRKLRQFDYHRVGTPRGIRWVGDKLPKNGSTKTSWQCSQGDVWSARYKYIQQGAGCPHCAKQKERKTKVDYHRVGTPRGIRWVGDALPKDTQTKTSWQCPQGDVWETAYNVIQQGHGCQHCAGLAHKTEADYHKVGMPRDIRWTGSILPKNVMAKTSWQCPQGDTWEAIYDSIRRGTGCPHCANMVNGIKVSSQQEWLCDLVAGKLNTYVEGYYVDITTFIDGVNIAIEYDGWHWHKDRLDKDAKRDADLIDAGWHILRVKSDALLPDERLVFNAIMRLLGGSVYEEIVLEDWGNDNG